MENKNKGVLISSPRANDFKFAGVNKIATVRSVKDWSIYLPAFETQRSDLDDFLNCVTMSAGHCIEMNLNYLMATNQLTEEALNFFHNNGYIVDGSFRISKRFNAKMNGTDIKLGQYLNVAGDCFRRDGFLPEQDWPMRKDMTWKEYYAPIPQELKEKAKKALWFVSIQYQFVEYADLLPSFKLAPVQIAAQMCSGWDSGEVVQKCSGQPLQHATTIYGKDTLNNWLDLDHYPPYTQKLAPDYELPYNLQYIVSMKPISLRRGMWGENVKNLQHELNTLGYFLSEDGSFGAMTEKAVIDYQMKNKLVSDGIAGPKTLITLLISSVAKSEGVEPEIAIAVAKAESGLDPNLFNYNTDKIKSIDKGLFQWNDKHHPEITEAMALNPVVATKLFCKAVKAGNLHLFWKYSEPNWKKLVSQEILNKYGII